VNLFLYLFFGLIGFLLFLFLWAIRNSKGRTSMASGRSIPEDFGRSHISHWPQIRQALAKTDYEFVSNRAPREVLQRMRRERRRVALAYLSALRGDFDELLGMARVIAVLSPEVAAVQEFERLRLTVNFLWRYRIIRMSMWAGYAPLPQMDSLGNLISGLSVRLEAAMKELGERAALVAEIVSSPDRRRIHPV
jgi:hypothetical protein